MNSQMWAALLGALVAGGIALMSQVISARQARSAARMDEAATRLAEFLSASHAAVLGIGTLAYLPPGPDPGSKDEFLGGEKLQLLRDQVNASINTIQLLDGEAVVRAVVEVDRTLVRLEDEALAKQWSRPDWRSRRSQIQGESIDRAYAEGRAALNRVPLDRPSLWISADRDVVSRIGNTETQRPAYGE